MKNVAFIDYNMCERGTTIATYDYALHNEKILGNKSFIFYDINSKSKKEKVINKFKKQFCDVIGFSNFSEVDNYISQNKITHLYNLIGGRYEPALSKYAKNCIHYIFDYRDYGDMNVALSPVIRNFKKGLDTLPHMVDLPVFTNDLRSKLGIPETATVFGGYGGKGMFNIKEAQTAVYEVASKNKNIYFLFANFHKFCDTLPNVIHLPCIVDIKEKVEFINSCDAMMWARKQGEVMSMAMGEFATKNKPIIATKKGLFRGHSHLLGDKAFWYSTKKSLINILENFDKNIESKKDWNAYREYTPEKVMEIFDKVFLK